ncbi:hypothetical protein MKK64_00850 [Methylobacterium sp. E-025]|uniref:hypothetical protein n=1 Tax=Methylobacterium sp. E-025 TaxID=2836561 RepID=UPI001FB8C4C6|nr:hypothetical protein [Methylobacterium sp. E-025]MCJ2109773.1 hypothetical protein [Methylobacterium sp. E-025]
MGSESVAGSGRAAARLAEIARSLAIPISAFDDPRACPLGDTAELLRLWQRIDDPQLRARVLAHVLASAPATAEGRGARPDRATPERDPPA